MFSHFDTAGDETPNIGWFIIDKETIVTDDTGKNKTVHCYSYEKTLDDHKVDIEDGTYQFWNPISPNKTLLGNFLAKNPTWKINYVSGGLLSKFRTFEMPDMGYYGFLISEVSQAYECIFRFDTNNRTVSAYTLNEATTKSDIFLSFDNVIKNLNIETTQDNIITGLHVMGDSTLDISTVNPLGTPIMWDFSYFKNSHIQNGWMSTSLVTAITAWETKVNSQQANYANKLTLFKTKNAELLKLNSEMTDLKSIYTSLKAVQTSQISKGDINLSAITNQMDANESLQKTKQAQINSKTNEIIVVKNELAVINNSLKFENNFSTSLYTELQNFMVVGKYQNEHFGVLSGMTPVEIQELAQELYNQGKTALKKLSQPYVYDTALVPIGYIKHRPPSFKRLTVCKYTPEGRANIHRELSGINTAVLTYLMRNPVGGKSIEYKPYRGYGSDCP